MYEYKTIDENGHRESGIVNIDDYAQAVEYVRKNYGMIIHLREIQEKHVLANGTYTDRQRTYFFKQLGSVLQSGITILEGLAIIGEGKDKKLVHICKQLSVRIANGLSISQSMSELPEFFTDLSITLVRAGEISGQLAYIATQIGEFYYKKEKLENYLKRAAIYPMVVFGAGIAVFLLFLLVVLPNIGTMYTTLRAPQGELLSTMLAVQKFLVKWWYVVLAVAGTGVYFLWYKRHDILVKFFCLPGLKSFYDEVLEIRFCKLLALLLNSGIGIIDAINDAALAVNDKHKYMELQRLKMALARGGDLAEVLEGDNKFFSPVVKGFISVGSRTGNLPQLILEAANVQEENFEHRMEKAKELLAPVLLIVVAIFIGMVVLSVMQPIFHLFDALPMY